MERLELIDDWKCLSATCGHRWDTTLTYAQLELRSARRERPGGAVTGTGSPACVRASTSPGSRSVRRSGTAG